MIRIEAFLYQFCIIRGAILLGITVGQDEDGIISKSLLSKKIISKRGCLL
jgi:hypothetical protein